MKRIVAVLIASILAHPTLGAQSSATDLQLIAARDSVWRAFFRNDTSLLARYIPPAAATLEGAGGGYWSSRQNILDNSRKFAKSGSKLVGLEFNNTQISISGHSALVLSNYKTVIETAGRRDSTTGRATELFVLVGRTWLNPYWQLEPGARLNDAGRQIMLPDTLGANFAIADSAALRGSPEDYDALIGTWEFRFQVRQEDGSFYAPFGGHWTFEKKPGGGLIEDRWRPDDPSSLLGESLYTYRNFDPRRKVWQMLGMRSQGGTVEPGLTWSDGTDRYAIQRANGGINRIRYLSIDPNHFFWRADRSLDGGKTWILDNAIMSATRIAR